jgi:hypothetical protein
VVARILILLFAAIVCGAALVPEARAARNDSEVGGQLVREYSEGNAWVSEYGVTAELDTQMALLRQVYVNTLMVRQGIVLDYLRWYGCKLPDNPLPPVPELNIKQFVDMASASAPGEDVTVANDRRLKINRVRILALLRDAVAINALPAACAGRASFAASDSRSFSTGSMRSATAPRTSITSRPNTTALSRANTTSSAPLDPASTRPAIAT